MQIAVQYKLEDEPEDYYDALYVKSRITNDSFNYITNPIMLYKTLCCVE